MSQTNEFAKAILPDYVYFDLQTSNIHNNAVGTIPQLRFEESRDAPVIENAGEYNMSVTRFSVDTATLPVLVVEPDLNDAGFDPHKTIHRVAIITEGANLKANTTGAITTTTTHDFTGAITTTAGSLYSSAMASSDDGEVVVIGEQNYEDLQYFVNYYGGDNFTPFDVVIRASGRGRVLIGIRNSAGHYAVSDITAHDLYEQSAIGFPITGNQPGSTNFQSTTITNNWKVGQSVAISGDGNIVFIGSSGICPYYWIFNRLTNAFVRHDKTLFSTKPSAVVGALNTTGSLYIVGYPNRTSTSNYEGGYEILAYDIATGVSTSRISVSGVVGTNTHMGHAVAMNGVGNIAVVTTNKTASSGTIDVIQSTSTPHYVSAYATYPYTSANNAFGQSISITHSGTTIAVGSNETNGAVRIVGFASGIFTTGATLTPSTPAGITPSIGAGSGFGWTNSISYDGNTIHIGAPNWNTNTGAVQSFQYDGSNWNLKATTYGTQVGGYYGYVVSSYHDGIEYVAGIYNPTNVGARAVKLNIATNETLPSSLRNTASVANVFWTPDNANLRPPNKTELNGINTATFPYYYCHSYNNFIDKVNDAIKDAYVANFNKLWVDWIRGLSVANADFIKAEFINIVARCFSTPPYMDWNPTLDANIYLNTLFSVADNYYYPARTFTATGSSPNVKQVSTTGQAQPLNLRLAFNASLYSLFAGFPATETIIDGERFYMLNMPKQVASLLDNSTIPLRALPLMPYYPFLYDYHNNLTKVFSLPFPDNSISTYPLQEFFIRLKQEISTIDAWCPVSSIVFTTNQLPILASQFSSSNTIGNIPSTATIGNRFALVITDLMTNQQGYRPNIIYNPSAEYRRISLTGNMPIREIDINVFWRPKTGQLLPFRLQSGGSASLKLLFEKKNKNPEKEKIAEPVNLDIMGGRMPKSRR